MGEDLVLDQVPLRPDLAFQKGLQEVLRDHGIEGVTFFRGLEPGELELFLAGAIGEVPPGSTTTSTSSSSRSRFSHGPGLWRRPTGR